jgi:hypothetical protein
MAKQLTAEVVKKIVQEVILEANLSNTVSRKEFNDLEK